MGKRLALVGLVSVIAGYALASTYIGRLSNHAGFSLVAVDDRTTALPTSRPRRAVFVVVDGLRFDAAMGMGSVAALRAAGWCARTAVGVPSVSRPVYAVLSTGLEQDRTGVRNNDTAEPLAAESLWEVARRQGLRVEGWSELPWWLELFPRGFDRYEVVPRAGLAFPSSMSADLTLVHPTYVDEAGHEHGAASPEYRAAVARVDLEIDASRARLDLREDLFVLTADHGHRDRGGHGGPSPDVAQVLTCFSGRGVRRASTLADLDVRTIAPATAVLLGLPFPRHLRAGEDDLDAIFEIADPGSVGETYLRARRAAVARHRVANAEHIRAWTHGSATTWSEFLALQRRPQVVRGALALSTLVVCMVFFLRRQSRSQITASLLFVAACTTGMFAGYALLSGGIDSTSLNRKDLFLRNTFVAAAAVLLLVTAVHRTLGRRLHVPLLSLLIFLLGINAAHIAAFGWPLGFPLPGPVLFYFPFLSSIFLLASGAYALVVLIVMRAWRRNRLSVRGQSD